MEKNIYRITEGAYHIFESLDVFCSLVVGTKAALVIDSGYGYGDIAAAAREVTDLPLLLLHTHGHADHVHGDYRFPEAMIHPDDVSLARKHSGLPYRLALYAMSRSQLSPEQRAGRRLLPGRTLLVPVEDGKVIDLGGGAEVEVIWTPGHTGGSVCALDRRDRILFSGDSFSSLTWLFLKESTSLSVYEESVRKVMARSGDFDEIISAHSLARFKPSLLANIARCADTLDPARSVPYDSRLAGKALLYLEGFERVTERYGFKTFDEFMRHVREVPPEAIAEMEFASIAFRPEKLE